MKNWGIREKFLTAVVPLIICSYVILVISANMIFYQDIIVRRQREVKDEAAVVAAQIQKSFTNISSCCKVISRDLNYDENFNIITQNIDTPLAEYRKGLTIRSVLYDNAIFFPEVQALAYIDYDRKIYVSDSRLLENWNDEICSELIAPLNNIGNIDIWMKADRRTYLTIDPNDIMITLSKNIMNMTTGKQMGQLFVSISESKVRDFYSEFEIEGQSWYALLERDGTIISASEPSKRLTKIQNQDILKMIASEEIIQTQTNLEGIETIVTGVPMQTEDFYLLNVTSIQALKQPVNQLSFMLILICGLTILIATMLIGFFSNKITRPLSKLVKEISRVENGNFKIDLPSVGNDEIGKLATEFNYMLDRINELFHTLETEQEQKEKLRFSLLQSQIKPHFFYNTLDMVYILINMHRTDEAERAVKALADFYRIALSSGRELITIGEEVENIKNYLLLQYMRRYDIFSYKVEVDESIKQYQIPKLTLQPLVENAIYHGLRVQEKAGSLCVSGYSEGEKIILKVSDTGAGMNVQQVQMALRSSDQSKSHFGLRNVDERIKLYFGKEYGLTIVSKEQEGTTVIVELGKLEENEQNE
ncbi:Probable sensor-like histidine kinase YehU [uncultured Ruminococcus sp.]|nr:Probable sensor-like histidine kinase YehU [uncultured Ruminococcus sp.]SCI19540.1 Probable sensor-like histidine kinase YehU [uncultured Clostridium sp.]